ncbi:MAG: hypothetical protein OXI19_16175 [Gemmatimonadota bacterium]|nr:hypothetical protein [Gemmatimonadota bacterium]
MDFEALPDLPQVKILMRIVSRLWSKEEVMAVWIGGSFGQGNADQYSDVDLRVAVHSAHVEDWTDLDLPVLFEGRCVEHKRASFTESGILHHLILDTGDLYDLWVQDIQMVSVDEPRKVLGCRDPRLLDVLRESAGSAVPAQGPSPDADKLRMEIVDFWMNSHKHRKVLHRGLDPLVIVGLQEERALMLRLWALQADDYEPVDRKPSIHALSDQVRSLIESKTHMLKIMGAPGRTRSELLSLIELHRDEVSRTGRDLAKRYSYAYPAELERTVRACWRDFLSSAGQ